MVDLHVSRLHFPRTFPNVTETNCTVEAIENCCNEKGKCMFNVLAQGSSTIKMKSFIN